MTKNFSDQEGTTSDEWAVGPTRLLGDFAGDISLGAIAGATIPYFRQWTYSRPSSPSEYLSPPLGLPTGGILCINSYLSSVSVDFQSSVRMALRLDGVEIAYWWSRTLTGSNLTGLPPTLISLPVGDLRFQIRSASESGSLTAQLLGVIVDPSDFAD